MLIVLLIAAIAFIVVSTTKFKLHPFLALIIAAIGYGLCAGIPLDKIIASVNNGFGSTVSSIGIVIVVGCIIGTFLEESGGAYVMARSVLRLVGEKRVPLAMLILGYFISIPVYADSGFVILTPLNRALSKKAKITLASSACALGLGLTITHCLIPPTPGPIAAAQTLGAGDYLLLVIGIGVLCSIFPLIAGFIYAKFIGKKIKSADETGDNGEVVKSYEELKAEFGKLPGGCNALAPLLVPILLMALSSVSSMAKWTGAGADLLTFLGTPIMALAVGSVLAIIQLFTAGKQKDFYTLTNETLKTVGPILFVTAAGGVLGKVISSSDMVNYITAHANALQAIGIFFPFLLAAILKSAQGSSTVAITTTAGIVAPLLPVLGFTAPVQIALVVMAIGAGAMTVSHANDSYFWVVTNFGDMQPEQGYKTQTAMTLVIGIAAIIEIFILSLIL